MAHVNTLEEEIEHTFSRLSLYMSPSQTNINEISEDAFKKISSAQKYIFFKSYEQSLVYTNIKTFKITINVDFFCIIDDYLLLYTPEEIKIASWSNDLKFKKIKTIKYSLLQFLIKTNSIDRNTIYTLCTVFLFFIKNNLKRPEQYLEQFIKDMCIENIISMKIHENKLYCRYKNYRDIVFDNKMCVLNDQKDLFEKRPNLENENLIDTDFFYQEGNCEHFKITPEKILLNRMNNIVEVIKIKNVKQIYHLNDFLFVCANKELHVIKFYK